MEALAHHPPETFREVRTCLVKKSSFPCRGRIGRPMWFGANAAPV